MACSIEYVMEGVVTTQPAIISADGNVVVEGSPEVHAVKGDTYAWCEVHQVRLTAGEKHEDLTVLSNEWEAI